MIFPHNVLIHTHKNVIWQGRELVESSCELWGWENRRLYPLVVSRTSCNEVTSGILYSFSFSAFFLFSLHLTSSSFLRPALFSCFSSLLLNLPFPSGIIFTVFRLSLTVSADLWQIIFLPGVLTGLSKSWLTEKGGKWYNFTFSF